MCPISQPYAVKKKGKSSEWDWRLIAKSATVAGTLALAAVYGDRHIDSMHSCIRHLPPLFTTNKHVRIAPELTVDQILNPHLPVFFQPSETPLWEQRETRHDQRNVLIEAGRTTVEKISHFINFLKPILFTPAITSSSSQEQVNHTATATPSTPVHRRALGSQEKIPPYVWTTYPAPAAITRKNLPVQNTTAVPLASTLPMIRPGFPRCALGGNETLQWDEEYVEPFSWWSKETSLSWSNLFAAELPTRQSSFVHMTYYWLFWAWIHWPLYAVGWSVINFPYIFFAKSFVWGLYAWALYYIYSLVQADLQQDRMKWEHEHFMSMYMDMAGHEELYQEFFDLLPPIGQYETMTGGRVNNWDPWSNKNVTLKRRVSVVLRKQAIENFMVKRKMLKMCGHSDKVEICYHGSKPDRIQSIVNHGLLVPGSLIPGTASKVTNSTDTGYFGCGIYVSPRKEVSDGYGYNGAVFVCLVLRGDATTVTYQMGRKLCAGYDSHVDPSGSEWILFDNRQVIPIYLIHTDDRHLDLPQWDLDQPIESVKQLTKTESTNSQSSGKKKYKKGAKGYPLKQMY